MNICIDEVKESKLLSETADHTKTLAIGALITDIRQAIEAASGSEQPVVERRFHKHNQYLSYRLKTAVFRKILKDFRPRFTALPLPERLDLAAKLLGEHIGELGHTGIHILSLSTKELELTHFNFLDQLVDDFRSWSHVDHFCIEILKPLLWKYRQETLAFLQNWTCSANRFKRRASVVAFTRKVNVSGEFTEDILRFCEALIWDEEDIVRKGVGWALKDNLRWAPDRVLPYIRDLRRRGVSSTIVLYAVRDLKDAEREAVLKKS
jgi:3-methyladenine DNA glycosylase AlkD